MVEAFSITNVITDAVAGVTADAGPVITAAVGLGMLFWGAKLLISKFKGMAK